MIITTLGVDHALVDAVHGYGGLVFHDAVSVRHAVKAIAAGVDGNRCMRGRWRACWHCQSVCLCR
ncbi:MAG: hypothetical protein WC816_15735 [Sphingomonas sp.]